jgi:hypothetical protein
LFNPSLNFLKLRGSFGIIFDLILNDVWLIDLEFIVKYGSQLSLILKWSDWRYKEDVEHKNRDKEVVIDNSS